MQTVLLALLQASDASEVTITGGTHNPMAPPTDFLQRVYFPVLQDMGARVLLHVERPGFMVAGGGVLRASISPLQKWKSLKLTDRGALKQANGQVLYAHFPEAIAERMRKTACHQLSWETTAVELTPAPASQGPGGIIMLAAEYEHATELTSSVAEMGRNAESIGISAAKQLSHYLGTTAAVGVHLADQLLLPLALAGAGKFTTFGLSKHFHTHCALIPQFLPVNFTITEAAAGVREVSVSKTTAWATPG
jgi:RNA 3'-terminal phosphate cyclase (ATP)